VSRQRNASTRFQELKFQSPLLQIVFTKYPDYTAPEFNTQRQDTERFYTDWTN